MKNNLFKKKIYLMNLQNLMNYRICRIVKTSDSRTHSQDQNNWYSEANTALVVWDYMLEMVL